MDLIDLHLLSRRAGALRQLTADSFQRLFASFLDPAGAAFPASSTLTSPASFSLPRPSSSDSFAQASTKTAVTLRRAFQLFDFNQYA